MPANITVALNVPPLPDNAVWFANAAAWNNYWLNGEFTGTIPDADTVTKGVVKSANVAVYADPANTATQRITFQVDGVDRAVPSANSFDELRNRFEELAASYKAMRTAMVAAGLLNNAQ